MFANPPTIASRGLFRRSFLMAMGSTILGTFILPTPLLAAESGPAPAAPGPEGRVAGRVRRLLAGHVWNGKGTQLTPRDASGGRRYNDDGS
ncbi:MAG TPA: hypothetical protein VG013_41070 [Gemmataceae bacterium]|jgi:hypothetical protein|nr:hypothetical protein [Gemmataceae bacterium]